MKVQQITPVVFALLYSSTQAIKVRDIFDAYDDEALIEANSQDDQIDPAKLTAEIGGEDIAREVKGATAGVQNEATMLQLDSDVQFDQFAKPAAHRRRIIDEDGDGVEDNIKKTQWELDKFRVPVYGVEIEDLHNTHNGEMPGHVRFGEGPEPGTDPWAKARAKEAAEKKDYLEKKAKAEKDKADTKKEMEETEQNVQLDSQLGWTKRVKMVPRRIIDADGDGVEDNRAVHRNWLDRFEEDVYGYYIDDIHNTHNGELPGHERWGEDQEPANRWNPFKPTENAKYVFAPGEKQSREADSTAKPGPPEDQAVQLEWKPREKMVPRRIIDADGDGVEDNRTVSRHWLDKIEADAYGYNIDDIHNTQNGELAGHDRFGDDPEPSHHWTTPFADRPKESLVQIPNLINGNGDGDISNSYYDEEYLQVKQEAKLHNYMQLVNGPEDLELLGFSRDFRPFKPVTIYDADGDGIEDNMKITAEQRDKFYLPNVYGAPIEHIYNTRNGNLPGERQKYFYDKQKEPENTYDIVAKKWNRLGDN